MKLLRIWATPLTIAAFIVMGSTGVLMFLHLDSGLNKVVHEWVGWAMVIGVVAHVVLNWRAFSTYFRRPIARVMMAAGAVVLGLSFWPVSGGGGSPVGAVMQAIGRSDAQTLIALSGHGLDEGLSRLKAAGFDAAPEVTVNELTSGDRGKQTALISILFQD